MDEAEKIKPTTWEEILAVANKNPLPAGFIAALKVFYGVQPDGELPPPPPQNPPPH